MKNVKAMLAVMLLALFLGGCVMGQSEWVQTDRQNAQPKKETIARYVEALNSFGIVTSTDMNTGIIIGECEENVQAYIIVSDEKTIIKSRRNLRSSEYGFTIRNEPQECIEKIKAALKQ